jgi:hypothetical protein
MVYWIKKKYRQIERTLSFLPLIWKGYDWDYRYAIDLFQKQLERTVIYLESDKAVTQNAKIHAQKIRTALRLIDIVYDDTYITEFLEGGDSENADEFVRVMKKQKRAHKLLWDFIEHNIQKWWD